MGSHEGQSEGQSKTGLAIQIMHGIQLDVAMLMLFCSLSSCDTQSCAGRCFECCSGRHVLTWSSQLLTKQVMRPRWACQSCASTLMICTDVLPVQH